MARNNHINNSFVSGEVSEKYLGRTDTQQYNQGCEKVRNQIIHPQGGASRRPGSIHKYEVLGRTVAAGVLVADSTKTIDGARLFPFTTAAGEHFQIVITTDEFDDGDYSWAAIDVDRANSGPATFDDIYPIIKENIVNEYDSGTGYLFDGYYVFTQEELDELQYAQSGDTIYFTHPKFRPFAIVFTGTQFNLRPVGHNADHTPRGRGTLAAGELENLWKQVPFRAEFGGETNTALDGLRITSLGSGEWRLTVDTTNGVIGLPTPYNTYFNSLAIGDYVKLSDGGNTGVFLVLFIGSALVEGVFVAGTHTTFTTGTIFGMSANPDSGYEFQEWEQFTNSGWPKTVGFFESRLVFAGTEIFPDSIWFSQVDDVNEFDYVGLQQDSGYSDPLVASDAFSATLSGAVISPIQWILPGKNITVGTDKSEYIIAGPDTTQTISRTNYRSSKESDYGSSFAAAAEVENAVVFIQRHKESLRELAFNFDEAAYKAADLSIIAEHIATRSISDIERAGGTPNYSGGFKQIVMQRLPIPLIWALDVNGRLMSCTRERIQQVSAWQHHQIGTDANADADAEIISISTIRKPKPVLDTGVVYGKQEDELWMLVKRRVGYDNAGTTAYVTRFFIERFNFGWQSTVMDDDNWEFDVRGVRAPVFMDCAKLVVSADYTDGVIDDLPHGVGAEVSVVCNGFWFGTYTIDVNGEIDISDNLTSPSETFKAIIGFNFEADLEPVTPEVQARLGTSMNLPRRIDEILVHFYRTLGVKYGRATDDNSEYTPYFSMEEISFPVGNTNNPPPLFTGVKKLEIPPNYERRPKILIRSHLPLPCMVTHLTYRMNVHE